MADIRQTRDVLFCGSRILFTFTGVLSASMTKYFSLGELLTDFRKKNSLTQADFAVELGVDVRTIARWENNQSLIKPDKEEEIVEKSFIPYQVVHNLNATVPMPLYYDFSIRKYSLTAIEQELPDAEWFRSRKDAFSQRVKPITTPEEVECIARYHRFLYPTDKPVSKLLIRHAAQAMPELNVLMYDTAGFYAGHRVAFSVSPATFQKLKNREMTEGDLRESHLVNFKASSSAMLYGYSSYADCNENFYYLVATLIRFIKNERAGNYTFGGLVVRHDCFELLEKVGLKKIWEDKEEQKRFNMVSPPTFMEGRFNEVLLGE